MAAPKKLQKIKSSFFSRGFQLAKLTASTGAKLTGFSASSFFSEENEKQEKWQLFLKNRATEFSQDLGELKGSLMKAGQMLSMYGEHFLPPEVNDLLKTLQAQSPPLEWAPIEQALRQSLSPAQLADLEIEHEALGSASIGQVHVARIKSTGEKIVLKIQYPDVDRAIDSDLKAIKSFLKLIKVLPKNINTDALFSEIRGMLLQEMDYELEARQTQAYGELLKNDDRFVVPKIYPQFCGKKVIASSFEHGLSPDDPLIQALSQERRNELSLNFIDLFFTELFQWGLVQTDPHLGNYRIRLHSGSSGDQNQNHKSPKDQLVLLDFGAVRNYPDSFLIPYRKMIQAALANSSHDIRKEAEELKFIYSQDPEDLLLAFEKFCLTTVEPFVTFDDPRNDRGQINAEGKYNWKTSDLPQRLTKDGFRMVQNFKLRPPPKEILFLDRKIGGVFIFCSVMRAEINSRNLLVKHF